MTRIAAVLVTHDSAPWLEATLASIEAQSRVPDQIVVVDDASTDATHAILAEHGLAPVPSITSARDTVTRIAANFVQGVRACEGADLVVIGDHDDTWHPDRVAHQAALMEWRPDALMVASDGAIVDAAGVARGGTVRDTFPVPADWEDLSPPDRMRVVLRRVIATGGASALRPSAFPDLDVPPGWLHDRWWSLVATARDGMIVDSRTVIDYRVQEGQVLGLDSAAQSLGPVARLASLLRQAGRSMGKQRDLRRRLRPLAVDVDVASAITLRNVL